MRETKKLQANEFFWDAHSKAPIEDSYSQLLNGYWDVLPVLSKSFVITN